MEIKVRNICLYFLIMPVIYTILMVMNGRVHSVDNIISLLIYGVLCIFLGIIGVYLYNIFKVEKNIKGIGIGITLISIDQLIKGIVVQKLLKEIVVIDNILKFSISKNINQNSIFNYLNIKCDFYTILIIKIILLITMWYIYRYFARKYKDMYFKYLNLSFIFMACAAVCNILDTLCWGYTVDYILFVNFMCCDLKDFYVDIGISLFIVYYFKIGMSKQIERGC